MKPSWFRTLLVACVLSGAPGGYSQTVAVDSAMAGETPGGTLEDTLLLDYSLEELTEIRDHYIKETERLLAEKDRLRQSGIVEMEALIASYPDSPILDKILIRLAELWYEQEVRDFERRMEAYLVQSDQFVQGEMEEVPQEPTLDFSRSLELYQRLIDAFPGSGLVDDATYNLAFLLEEMGDRQEAAVIYESLARTTPDSKFAPDAWMRVAEYFFHPPVSNIERAIQTYKKVLAYKEDALYDAALYRLGWAYYRLSDYPAAISHFTVLADDIDRVKPLDPRLEHHFPAVRDEAVEYIGISFLDFGGARQAAAYFDQIGGRNYGYEVFKKIGDAYMDVKEEYEPAIQAYEFLLAMYPHTPDAPTIQARITRAYRNLENEQLAYSSRKELFRKFGKDSDWWQRVSLADRSSAEELAERAMRENIFYLLKSANETGDKQLYRQAVQDSREYLAAFRSDSNAARIHWNMALVLDVKLGEHEAGFKEYINISNLYLHSKYRRQAAENAIALADERGQRDSVLASAYAQESVVASRTRAGRFRRVQVQPQELTDDEKRLVFALDNYIKNFPHEPETEKILAKTGGLYYEKRRFRETIKYFKTLARHFPESEDANYARYITMESYFGKGDYRSTELLAKRIREKSHLYGERARTRLSEAIFLQAQAASDSSDHLRAAREYLRLVAETPDSKIADRALYNAGLEFEYVKEYGQAITTYTQLTQHHPQSQYTLPALNNLAFDYREVSDFHNAGVTYQKLAQADTNRSNAQAALYNASVSFVQAEAWEQAIAVNHAFAERFPGADEADDLLFDNAGHYLKLDSLEAANEIYARFTQKFPDSPRVIEAYLRRGQYFKEAGEPGKAKLEFESAIQKYEEFKQRNLDPDEFLVAEALFQLAEVKFAEYASIEFELPTARIAQNKAAKKKLLLELVEGYSRVAGYGTLRLYEATYKLGRAYEEFAQTWAGQQIAETDEAHTIVARNEINQTSAELYERAIKAYRDGARALQKFAEKNLRATAQDSEQVVSAKLTVEDSTLQVAQTWIGKCQEKVSENLFQMAELKNESLARLLNSPIPEGMTKLEELVYRSQVLQQAVAPLAKEVIEVHLRNLEENEALNLENAWVDSSRDKIIMTSRVVPHEKQKLSHTALACYADLLASYETLVDKDDEQAVALSEQLRALVEFSTEQALAATSGLNESLGQAQAVGADSLFIAGNEHALMSFVYEYAGKGDSLAALADYKREHYEALFEQTQQMNHEDAMFTFDDLYFALSDGAHNMLRLGYETSEQLVNPADWTQKMALALIMKSPEEYASKFGLEFEVQTFPSSRDWLVATESVAGWQEVDATDTGWRQADSVGRATHLNDSEVSAIWMAHSTAYTPTALDADQVTVAEVKSDSVVQERSDEVLVRSDTVYFRKSFELPGLPVSGSIELFLSARYQLFLNGKEVVEFDSEEAAQEPRRHDLTPYLRLGNNVLAIAVVDSGRISGGLETVIKLKSVANWTALREGGIDFSDRVHGDMKTEEPSISE
ncbi:MAG: tetratricopeptide repeat protein [bacterium]